MLREGAARRGHTEEEGCRAERHRGEGQRDAGQRDEEDRRAGACIGRKHRVNNPTQMRQRGRGTKGREENALEMSRSHFLVLDSP